MRSETSPPSRNLLPPMKKVISLSGNELAEVSKSHNDPSKLPCKDYRSVSTLISKCEKVRRRTPEHVGIFLFLS